jgi:hypothetical protein
VNTRDVDAQWAVIRLAHDVQDQAIEETGGQSLPPCPEHSHPLSPGLIDNTAQWACPVDPGHYSRPILS